MSLNFKPYVCVQPVRCATSIAVPVGPGCIFTDGSVELRRDYTNLNATLGYKMQF